MALNTCMRHCKKLSSFSKNSNYRDFILNCALCGFILILLFDVGTPIQKYCNYTYTQ